MKKRIEISVFILSLIILLVFPGLVQAEKYKIKVILENANIRLRPDMEGKIIEMAPLGAILESDLKMDAWYHVKLPPDERGFVVFGYIHSSMTEIISVEQETKNPVTPHNPVISNLRQLEPPPAPQQAGYPQFGQPPSRFGMAMQFYGGMNYLLSLGDIDDGFQGLYEFRDDDPYYEITSGQYQPPHVGQEFGGEVLLNFTHQFGLKIGAGFLHTTKESIWNAESGFLKEIYTANPQIKVIPLTIGFFLSTSPINPLRFSINAGIGYYLGTIEWNHVWQWEMDDSSEANEEVWKGKSNSFGYHGGLGIEINIGSGFSFVIEGLGRYVKFKDILGELTVTHVFEEDPPEENVTTHENRIFWYADYNFGVSNKMYSRVLFKENEPSGNFYSNVRKGIINLTGFSARAGFNIRFK